MLCRLGRYLYIHMHVCMYVYQDRYHALRVALVRAGRKGKKKKKKRGFVVTLNVCTLSSTYYLLYTTTQLSLSIIIRN